MQTSYERFCAKACIEAVADGRKDYFVEPKNEEHHQDLLSLGQWYDVYKRFGSVVGVTCSRLAFHTFWEDGCLSSFQLVVCGKELGLTKWLQ